MAFLSGEQPMYDAPFQKIRVLLYYYYYYYYTIDHEYEKKGEKFFLKYNFFI